MLVRVIRNSGHQPELFWSVLLSSFFIKIIEKSFARGQKLPPREVKRWSQAFDGVHVEVIVARVLHRLLLVRQQSASGFAIDRTGWMNCKRNGCHTWITCKTTAHCIKNGPNHSNRPLQRDSRRVVTMHWALLEIPILNMSISGHMWIWTPKLNYVPTKLLF